MRFLVNRWHRIGARLYMALGFAVFLTLVSSAVGVYYFERSGDLNYQVRSESVPVLEASWAAAREAERLRALGLGLLVGPESGFEATQTDSVAESLERLENALGVVSGVPVLAADAQEVQGVAHDLAGFVDDIALSRRALSEANAAAVDLRLRLQEVSADAGASGPALVVLYRALSAHDQPALDGLWDEFVTLSAAGGESTLRGLGGGDRGVFAVRGQQLALQARIAELAVDLNDSSVGLENTVSRLVDGAGRESAAALESTVGSFDQGRVLLAAISVASVVAATLASWLWVGNGLVRRLSRLSVRMRQMAGGDLAMPVPEVGRDEIGELAHALEVFRQQALEVQRLNLVEQLYGELREANAELTRMQGQLVAQEKLAALGELVSGVAHEISNPLNFIKNFSEGSLDLYGEMTEILEGYRGVMSETDTAQLDEVGSELRSSLDRVRSNGGRVWSIVERMRGLGVVGGEPVPADLNAVLRVAAQAACSTFETEWGDFTVQPVFDLDESVGSVPLVTNDFGEAVKNLVLNACYAMRLKRNSEGDGYGPRLAVSSHRVDDIVEVLVRDNGTGIADDVVGHIFNPFFSTREGVLGAGLGLTVAADVARRAGGGLSVDSIHGEYAEFMMVLPADSSAVAA